MGNFSIIKMNDTQVKRYRRKYKHMKTQIKSLVIENAALCDEVAKIQETIMIVKDERKYLLRKLLEYERELEMQSYHRMESAAVNGPKPKIKKRRSLEDGGKSSTT